MEWEKKVNVRPGHIDHNASWVDKLMVPAVPPATWQEWDEFFERLALIDPMTFNLTVVQSPGDRSACVAYGFARQTDRHNPAYQAWRFNAARYAKKHKLGVYSGK